MTATETTTAPTTHAAPGHLLGPAMRFVLVLEGLRARRHHPPPTLHVPWAVEPVQLPPLGALWELAERFHPEQTWLAESWLRGDRTLADVAATAPREPLARGFVDAARRLVPAAPLAS